jgi:hypothetical protein
MNNPQGAPRNSAERNSEVRAAAKIQPFPPSPDWCAASGIRSAESGIIFPFSTCARTTPHPAPRHLVMMFFRHDGYWRCQFMDAGLRATFNRPLNFNSVDKLIAFADRGGGLASLKRREAFNRAIQKGRGAVLLELNDHQYALLKTAC